MNLFPFFYLLTFSYASTISENAFFFPLSNFCFFVENQVSIGVCIYVRVFNSIPLIHLSVFMPIPICFYCYRSVVLFEIRVVIPLEVPLLYKIDCFSYPGFFFVFPYEVECSVKNCVEILMGFHWICKLLLNMLILLILECGRSFHLLISSPISFFKDLKFLSYMSFTCLVRVTPRPSYTTQSYTQRMFNHSTKILIQLC